MKYHPEHNELIKWAGGGFDSEKFDINELNKELQYKMNFIQKH